METLSGWVAVARLSPAEMPGRAGHRQAAAQGDALTARGQFSKAAPGTLSRSALALSDSTEYHYRLAGAAERAGQTDSLERHLHEAVQARSLLCPRALFAWKIIASAHLDRAIYHTAITIALAPRDARYVADMASCVMTGQSQAALGTKSSRLSPNLSGQSLDRQPLRAHCAVDWP